MPVLPRSADGTAKPHAPISPETIRVLALLLAGMGVLFAFASPAHADPNRSTELKLSGLEAMVDRVVPKQLAEGKIPGAVVTVVAGGETVFTRGYGVADVDSEVPMDPETTQLPTASVGKLFTATAALQLVREGKLDLNADVNQYLDDFSVPDAYPGQPVTLHHLLTYTSGFDNDIYGWAQWGADEMPSLADFTARAQPKRIRPPGELVAYNNYDFVLTGRLIEIASGQPFADYVAEHVFDPVGMSATAIQGNHDQGSDVATTYRPDGDTQVETAGLHSPATPTGGDMITTGGDLARFMIAQLDQDAALGQDVTRQMQSQQFTAEPRIPGMGYAFEQRPRNGQPIVAKDGDLPGIHHNLALIPEAGLGIHVAYNGDGVGGVAFWDAKDLTYKIIDEALPDSEGTSNNQVSTDVSGYAGNYGDSRTSRTTFTAVTGLTNPITVEAAGPGRLITSGMSEDPSVAEQHWHQVEPGLFRSDDADATLAFGAGGTMVTSQAPAAGFQKLSWQQSPMLHLAIVGVAAVLLAVAFVLIPIRALVRRSRTGSAHTAQGRVALILGWLAAACVVIFGGAFAYLASDPNRMMQVPLTGTLLLSIALNTVSVLGVITAAVVVLAVLAWVRRWWKLPGRIAYSVLALAAIAFLAVAVTYRLVGVPLTVTV